MPRGCPAALRLFAVAPGGRVMPTEEAVASDQLLDPEALLQPGTVATALSLESAAAEGAGHARQVKKLESKALNGAIFIILTTAAAVVLRLVNSIVFSHLFMPELFGLVALVTTIMIGINLFSHIGLQESVIQNPRGDEPAFLNTAWTLQLIRSFGMLLAAGAIAWPAARFYHDSRLAPLLIVLGFTCVIAACSSSSLLSMARHIQVRELTLLELFAQLVAFVGTVIWALFSPTLWALMGGRILSDIARCLVSYGMMRGVRPRLMWDKTAVREIVKFGKWILIGTGLTFLASQSDRLILGKLITLKVLALYGIAYALSDLPRQIILQFCSKVGFPFIAKFMESPRPEFRRVLLKYRAPVLLLGAVLLSVTICSGDLFISHVYDTRYHGAGWMVGILGLGLWHTLLYSTISPAIFALQKSHYNAIAQFVYCVTLFVALPLGYHSFGMLGAVVAVAISDLPMYFCFLFSAMREGISPLGQDLLMTLAFVAILLGSLELRHLLGFGGPFPSAAMLAASAR
jgi:O-antigen/teichoic acid export membrane protein